jgi:hypothetical protein
MPPPRAGLACTTTAPVTVVVTNVTRTRGDLCGAFARAASHVAWPTSLPPNTGFAVDVMLGRLDLSSDEMHCAMQVTTTSSQQGTLDQTSASAKVVWNAGSGGDRHAARDCVDALLENVLEYKVVPALQASIAPSAPSPTSAPSPAPSSSTAVP